MAKFKLKHLTARAVRKQRAHIAKNRCPERPGLTHQWEDDYLPDPSSFGSFIEFWTCAKCGANDGL